MNFITRARIAGSVFIRGMAAAAQFAGTAYKGAAKFGGPFKQWKAQLSSADREWLDERNTVVARCRDLARNDTAVASARRRRVSSAVGTGWLLSARVDGELLGFTPEETEQLNRQIERQWRAYAYGHTFEMDGQRQSTFGGLLRTAANCWFIDGECFAALEWRPGEMASSWGTRLNIIDSDRVSNPNATQDTDRMRAGIEHHAVTGAPVAYYVRSRHPDEVGMNPRPIEWRRIDRWTEWGRPQFLHVYDRERPGQSRGVSQLASALSDLKSLRRFTEATIENAILQALMLGAVESNGGPQAVSESLSAEEAAGFETSREEVYGGRTVDLGGVQLAVLPHGDKLNIHTQGREVASFEGFTRAMLRRVAAALGTTYEELAMDYSTTNYSSARAAMIHAYAETQALQTLLRDQLVQPLFVAWLEEAFETGRIELPAGAPDYWENLSAYTRARWISPGRGFIDATKEIDAAAKRIGLALSTAEDEAAEQGVDWREIAEQRAREIKRYAELGIVGAIEGANAAAIALATPSPAPAGGGDERPQTQPEAA